MIEGVTTYLAINATSSSYGELAASWFNSVHGNIPVILGAFTMGMIGSIAYYAALRLGYTGGEQRDWLLKNFGSRQGGVAAFILIGGAVSTVFQLPEPDKFVAIQSFVLGVTWPIIVAQYSAKVTAPRPPEVDRLLGEG
jgi:hypothetical protein